MSISHYYGLAVSARCRRVCVLLGRYLIPGPDTGRGGVMIIRGRGGRERRVTNVIQWPKQNRILSIETPAGRENGFNWVNFPSDQRAVRATGGQGTLPWLETSERHDTRRLSQTRDLMVVERERRLGSAATGTSEIMKLLKTLQPSIGPVMFARKAEDSGQGRERLYRL